MIGGKILMLSFLLRKGGFQMFVYRSLAFVWFAFAANAVPQGGQPVIPGASGDLSVYESVIRFQIKSWELEAHTFCIKVNNGDADKTLLERLYPLPVKAASGCKEINRKTMMRVVDKETKKNSVIFDVGAIYRLNDSELDVEGGYLCASLCMAGGRYHLVRENSGWRVTSFKWDVIS